jgi:hypothetical protein
MDVKNRKAFIILGNGFTIDFLSHYKKMVDPQITDKIDVCNLFRLGDRIKSPWDKRPGFLSYKTCQNLWTLGARPGNTIEESNSLIEEIITCANMYFDFATVPGLQTARSPMKDSLDGKIYLKAYLELMVYFHHLFSHYNSSISEHDLKLFLGREKGWGWLDFFGKIKTKQYEKITIVTYNYDLWLERILNALNVPFFVYGLEDGKKGAVEIIKPHGSISFIPNKTMDSTYEITYDWNNYVSNIKQLNLKYEGLEQYYRGELIPPAGDSSRIQVVAPWAHELRERASEVAKEVGKDNVQRAEVVLCGISYWHVDRREIDTLLLNMNQDVEFMFINPQPPRDLNAVLTSIFKNYIHQSSAVSIGGLLDGKII